MSGVKPVSKLVKERIRGERTKDKGRRRRRKKGGKGGERKEEEARGRRKRERRVGELSPRHVQGCFQCFFFFIYTKLISLSEID